MKTLGDEISHFFKKQNFVIVSTIDKNGGAHSSCKGIVKIDRRGRVYLLDLYKGRTYENLKQNPNITITAVEEHRFIGWCLKGKAKIIKRDKLKPHIIKTWENKIVSRIAHRIIKNIQGVKGHSQHPEILLPRPEYLIVMEVDKVVDLTPSHFKHQEV